MIKLRVWSEVGPRLKIYPHEPSQCGWFAVNLPHLKHPKCPRQDSEYCMESRLWNHTVQTLFIVYYCRCCPRKLKKEMKVLQPTGVSKSVAQAVCLTQKESASPLKCDHSKVQMTETFEFSCVKIISWIMALLICLLTCSNKYLLTQKNYALGLK